MPFIETPSYPYQPWKQPVRLDTQVCCVDSLIVVSGSGFLQPWKQPVQLDTQVCCVDSLIVVSGSGFLVCKQQPDSLALYLLICILIQHSDNYMMGGGCLGNGSLSDFFQQTHSSVLKLPSRMLSSMHEKQEPNSRKRVVEMFTQFGLHTSTQSPLCWFHQVLTYHHPLLSQYLRTGPTGWEKDQEVLHCVTLPTICQQQWLPGQRFVPNVE